MNLDLPRPGDRRVAVRVTRDALRQIRGGHPWVYDSAVRSVGHDGNCGDLAVIFDDKRKFVAIGLFDPHSPIRIRILHRGRSRSIDHTFWVERLALALDRRRLLIDDIDTSAYRCVHGENDALPGLVIDRYDQTWVVRLDTAAWLPHLEPLVAALAEVAEVAPQRIVLRLSRNAAVNPITPVSVDGAVLTGPGLDGPIPFRENGLRFEADVAHGQKTGHFLDQRDNRARVRQLASGARVLDVFCCTGGFTVHAAAGGARSVHSIDASPHAIAAVEHNLLLNQHHPDVASARTTSQVGDAFETMTALVEGGRRFEMVIVDPPSFASKQADVDRALAAYGRLTGLAVDLLAPGGLLVQSSCSSRVGTERFVTTIVDAAARAGRRLAEVEQTGHGVDHPVGFAQGAYLKTVFARI